MASAIISTKDREETSGIKISLYNLVLNAEGIKNVGDNKLALKSCKQSGPQKPN